MARDTSTLRGILFDELESLRNGTSEPKMASAVAKLASQIIGTAKVEMEFHKLAAKMKAQGGELVLGAMDLGERAVVVDETSHHKTITHDAESSE